MAEGEKNIVSRRTLLKAGVWFSLINSIFFLILSCRYFSYVQSEVLAEAPVYMVFATFIHSIILSFVPFIFVFLPITILTKNKRKSAFTASISQTLFLVLFIVDVIVYSSYRFHLNKYVIEQVFAPGATQVFELSASLYLLAFVVLFLFITFEYFIFSKSYKLAEKFSIKKIYFILGTTFGLYILSNFIHAAYMFDNNRAIISFDRTLPFYSPVNLNKAFLLSSPDKEFKTNFSKLKYNYPKDSIKCNPTNKNIIMVVLDSWRYDALNAQVMPNVYDFSKCTERYNKHYSGSNSTKCGMFSLMYGMSGVFFNDFVNHSISPVLMNSLLENNYDVKLFPSASLRNPPLDLNAFLLYYDQCDATKGDKAWQRDFNLANNFMKYVSERDTTNPFFALLFFDSLHSMIEPDNENLPFKPAWSYPQYAILSKNSDPTEFVNLYKNMAFYLDKIIGNVISVLKNKGLLENSVVIFTGDHAQEFNENGKGFWGHNGNFSEAQLHVPFLYYEKNCEPKDVEKWSAHYDVAPTIMEDVFGVKSSPENYSFGHSLHDSTYVRRTMLVDTYIGYGIIDENGYIYNYYYDGDSEIYDKKLNIQLKKEYNKDLYNEYINQINSFIGS